MDRTSLRAWRRKQLQRVWRKRVKYYANQLSLEYDCVNYIWTSPPRDWKAYRKANKWTNVLKTTATPCSCWMCRNYLYDRRAYKRETLRILNES